VDPNTSADPNTSVDPNTSANPGSSEQAGTSGGPGPIVITTPGTVTTSDSPGASASLSPSPSYYTSPTSHMKRHAQKGYVKADGVNMRKTPNAKTGALVKSKIAKNTALTLYVEQEGWWFVQCGDKYGYIKKDYVAKGNPPKTAAPSASATSKPVTGKVNLRSSTSVAALRHSADKNSKCIKEYSNGAKMTVYYYVKGSDGYKWYYVKMEDGKSGYMRSDLVSVSGKVGSK
jgi:uncharacterized protein YgiM (DUF1202 family)